jgi:hypothetical protein
MASDKKRQHSLITGIDSTPSASNKLRKLDIAPSLKILKRDYEVTDLVNGTEILDLIDDIAQEPRIGRCIRQIRYHPRCEECEEDEVEIPDTPDEDEVNFIVSHITRAGFLDSTTKERLVEDIKSYN